MNRHLSGMPAWLVQRLSAVYLALFAPFFAGMLLFLRPHTHTAWRALMGNPVMAVASTLFFLALLLHAWVGMRDVILDYAGRRPGVRLLLLALLGFWLLALGAWVVRILLRVMLS